MGIFSNFFSDETSKVVDSVGSTIDKVFTSDEERLKAHNLLEEIKVKSKEIDLKVDEQITKRWNSDNEHIITRLVRPFSYIAMLSLFIYMVIGGIEIKDAFIPVVETIIITMTLAYFGGRSVEKTTKFIKGK